MEKVFDIFEGPLDGINRRIARGVGKVELDKLLKSGLKIETEHQIGCYFYHVFLVKE